MNMIRFFIVFMMSLVIKTVNAADCSINDNSNTTLTSNCDGFDVTSDNENTITINDSVNVQDTSNTDATIGITANLENLFLYGSVISQSNTSSLEIGGINLNKNVSITNLNIFSNGILGNSSSKFGVKILGEREDASYYHSIQNVTNNGIIGGDYAIYLDHNSKINSITNTGQINGDIRAITLFTEGLNGNPFITNLINSGTITGGTGNAAILLDSDEHTSGNHITYITNLINTGTITVSGGSADFDIYIDSPYSYITNLYNDQGGSDALTYYGDKRLPTNYYIIINNDNDYGKIRFLGFSGPIGSMNFEVDATRSRSDIVGTYTSVIDSSESASSSSNKEIQDNITNLSGTVRDSVWRLIDDDDDNVWDLVIYPSTSDTNSSIQNISKHLGAEIYEMLMSSNYQSLDNYKCSLSLRNNKCLSMGMKMNNLNDDSSNIDKTSLHAVYGYKRSNIEFYAFVDDTVSYSNSSFIDTNHNPLLGIKLVWDLSEIFDGTYVSATNSFQKKDLVITRRVVGSSEKGIGATSLASSALLIETGYQLYKSAYSINPFLGLLYSRIKMDSYRESIASNPLTFDKIDNEALTLTGGIKLSFIHTPDIMSNVNLGYEHDIQSDQNKIKSSATYINNISQINTFSSYNDDRKFISYDLNYKTSNSIYSLSATHKDSAYFSGVPNSIRVDYSLLF